MIGLMFLYLRLILNDDLIKKITITYMGTGSGTGNGIYFFFVLRNVNNVNNGLNFFKIFFAFNFLNACISFTCVPNMRNISRTTKLSRKTPGPNNFEFLIVA